MTSTIHDQEEKYCSCCRQLKPTSEFYFDKSRGRSHSVCKRCANRSSKERIKKYREDPEYRRKENERWMRYYHTNEEFRERHKRRAAERERVKRAKQKHESIEQACRNCVNYPCFEGMENIESNLAETCKSWHLRDKS